MKALQQALLIVAVVYLATTGQARGQLNKILPGGAQGVTGSILNGPIGTALGDAPVVGPTVKAANPTLNETVASLNDFIDQLFRILKENPIGGV